MSRCETLMEVLVRLGYTTMDYTHGRKHILMDGEVVFTGMAGDVWDWLREYTEDEPK